MGTTASVVDLKVGPDGALYYLARGSGGATGAFTKSNIQLMLRP